MGIQTIRPRLYRLLPDYLHAYENLKVRAAGHAGLTARASSRNGTSYDWA